MARAFCCLRDGLSWPAFQYALTMAEDEAEILSMFQAVLDYDDAAHARLTRADRSPDLFDSTKVLLNAVRAYLERAAARSTPDQIAAGTSVRAIRSRAGGSMAEMARSVWGIFDAHRDELARTELQVALPAALTAL